MKRFVKFNLAIALALASIFGIGCDAGELKDFGKNLKAISQSYDDRNFEMSSSVSDLIEKIEIKDGYETQYDRGSYTSSTQSYYFNGEEYDSIRSYAYNASKWMVDGIYTDPYTGEAISIESTDYDHIIPLHYANMHGAEEWADTAKREYADDPFVGVVVNSGDNRAKGDKGPSEWLPEENVEDYCYTWLVIAAEYDLSMDSDDMETIKRELNGVPESELQRINLYN